MGQSNLVIWVTAGKRKMIPTVYCSDTKLSLQIENTEQIKKGQMGTLCGYVFLTVASGCTLFNRGCKIQDVYILGLITIV